MNAPPPQQAAPKLGLALSGGGHRAAFFHIGVLAKLAELGLLRKLEVISTVSGGSIVGALYYLRLKAKLDEKGELDDSDFFEIVRKVADDYTHGAGKNLRALVLLSPLANLRYAFPNYTRTDRMGELYEKHFYKAAWGDGPVHDDRIAMCDLVIKPGGDESFKPSEGNRDPNRKTKVPVLLLNATTLNTGHNWRFEAQYMGEPLADDADSSDVDKNLRLRRTAWDALPPKGPGPFAIDYRHFPLGAAVASSACFPLGFPPKALPRLFERAAGDERAPMIVELVDGGVHDNQGIEGLLDADREHHACTHLIVSDASGQMADIDQPSGRIPKLLPRIVSIEGDVDREQRVLRAIEGCDRATTPPEQRVAFMHLQTGLSSGGLSPKEVADDYDPERASPFSTGVERRVQQLLSRVRTDLDAFSDVEAYSLMLDGYRICGAVVPAAPAVAGLAAGAPVQPDVPWRFLDIAPELDSSPPSEWYLRRLRVAEARFFKPARLAIGALAARLRKQEPAAKESAHRLVRQRWTARAFGVFWLAVAAALVFAGTVLDGHHFNAVWVYVAGIAIVGGLVLYAAPDIPGLHRVSRGFFSILMPLVVWPLLPLLALLQLGGGRLHLRYGRVPPGSQAGERVAPEASGAHVPR
jgi:NTE family protein